MAAKISQRDLENGPLAQLVEQGTFNPKVGGSSPPGPTIQTPVFAGVSSNGRTLVFGASYRGSNPCTPATFPLVLCRRRLSFQRVPPGFEPVRSEAVEKTALRAVFRPTGGARQRGAVVSRSETESLYPSHIPSSSLPSAALVPKGAAGIRTGEVGGRRENSPAGCFQADGRSAPARSRCFAERNGIPVPQPLRSCSNSDSLVPALSFYIDFTTRQHEALSKRFSRTACLVSAFLKKSPPGYRK